MKLKLFGTTTIAALAFGLPALAQTPIKIGFISTFSGPQAAIGDPLSPPILNQSLKIQTASF